MVHRVYDITAATGDPSDATSAFFAKTQGAKTRQTFSWTHWHTFGVGAVAALTLLYCVHQFGWYGGEVSEKLFDPANLPLGHELANESDSLVYRQFLNLIKELNYPIKNDSELIHRFRTFATNLAEIQSLQAESANVVYEINEFALMTTDELQSRLMPSNFFATHLADTVAPVNQSLETLPTRPAFFDWRTKGVVGRVKSQGSCGSCWAFSVASVVESLNAIKNGTLEELSEQQLVDCNSQNQGCGGGYRPYAFDFVQNHGLTLERLYPYTGRVGTCRDIQAHLRYVSGNKGLGRDEGYIADWIAAKGPVTVGVQVIKSMYSYSSGVFNPPRHLCLTASLGSHAMTIVGYGEENGETYWLLKNSWGTTFGSDGYLKMKRGINACSIAETVFTAYLD